MTINLSLFCSYCRVDVGTSLLAVSIRDSSSCRWGVEQCLSSLCTFFPYKLSRQNRSCNCPQTVSFLELTINLFPSKDAILKVNWHKSILVKIAPTHWIETWSDVRGCGNSESGGKRSFWEEVASLLRPQLTKKRTQSCFFFVFFVCLFDQASVMLLKLPLLKLFVALRTICSLSTDTFENVCDQQYEHDTNWYSPVITDAIMWNCNISSQKCYFFKESFLMCKQTRLREIISIYVILDINPTLCETPLHHNYDT